MPAVPASAPHAATDLAAIGSRFGLRFHHLGWIVPQPDTATRFLGVLGYRDGPAVFDPLQQVNLAMRYHDTMPDIELIWPGPAASPIARLARAGHMIYHVCFVADDAAASVAAMTAAGFDVLPVTPARPAVLFGGTEVSFHMVGDISLIELIHGEPLIGPIPTGSPS